MPVSMIVSVSTTCCRLPTASLWSRELNSFLVPDQKILRLSDPTSQLRLTEAEARAQQAEAETAARQAAEQKVRVLLEKLRS